MPQPKRLAVQRLNQIGTTIIATLTVSMGCLGSILIVVILMLLSYWPIIGIMYLLNKLIDKI